MGLLAILQAMLMRAKARLVHQSVTILQRQRVEPFGMALGKKIATRASSDTPRYRGWTVVRSLLKRPSLPADTAAEMQARSRAKIGSRIDGGPLAPGVSKFPTADAKIFIHRTDGPNVVRVQALRGNAKW